MPQVRRLWTREEFILVLNLYYKLPFGKLHRSTPEVQELAHLLGRSVNSIALRLVNFAACDPYILESGRHGMASGAVQCKPYWDEFYNNRENLLFESEKILAKIQGLTIEEKFKEKLIDIGNKKGETRIQEIKARVNQHIFHQVVLSNYEGKCALTGIDIPDLLIASHIKPWAKFEEERLNLDNGICLSALYDKCFDRGLIGFDQDYRVVLSNRIKEECSKDYYEIHFGSIEKKQLYLPEEHKPNRTFLSWHMDEIFVR